MLELRGQAERAKVVPPYVPSAWLPSGVAMTLATQLPRWGAGRWRRAAELREFTIDAHNRVLTAIHWQPERSTAPTVLLAHGLAGDVDAEYMLGLGLEAWRWGFNVVRLNSRNSGGTEHLARNTFHGGQSEDPERVLVELAEELPGPLFAAGFSLGANIVLRMAGRAAERLPAGFAGAVGISPPLDLGACCRELERTRFNRLVTRRFLRRFDGILDRRARHWGDASLPRPSSLESLWEFDERITAPQAGYPSVEAYYADAAAEPTLDRARVPLRIIHALDDPLIPAEDYLRFAAEVPPGVELLLTERGGHVGFFAGARAAGPRGRDGHRRWAEHRALDFLVERAMALGWQPPRPLAPAEPEPAR
ncbi:MAG: YheT family hydrolase [Planctomycetota bacterium]|jgi:predicted alpha/beta-fold hydrolase